jgi:hypothetical protein
MIINIFLYIIVVHAISAIIYGIFIVTGNSYLRKASIVPIIFIPVFGPIAGIVVELLNISKQQDSKLIDLPQLTLGEDIYWKTIKRGNEDENIVPLEEVLLINDVPVRRKIVLDTLYDNPLRYLDVMLVARHNEDIETSHYATTMISEAQRKFQLQIQRYAIAIEENPDDMELLDEYIETLGIYIDSGLLEDYLLKQERIVYSKVLETKLSKENLDYKTLIKYLRNNIALKNYMSAVAISGILKRNWPEDEKTWIEALRVCIDGHDKRMLQETIQEIRNADVNWSENGKEQVALWVQI